MNSFLLYQYNTKSLKMTYYWHIKTGMQAELLKQLNLKVLLDNIKNYEEVINDSSYFFFSDG